MELQKQKKILEDLGYKVAYICVYGSQNYALSVNNDSYQSDLDMKAIIIPSLDDLVNETKPVSKSLTTEWGLCDLKDIRFYVESLGKANPVYIESLYTDFFISTPEFDEIRALRKEIIFSLAPLFVRGAFGMIMEKREALCHPYPSIADKVEKYGYDPKQLHHIIRLNRLIQSLIPGKTEPEFLIRSEVYRDYLLEIKTKPMELSQAVAMADTYVASSKEIRDRFVEKHQATFEVKDQIKEIARRITKNSILAGMEVSEEIREKAWKYDQLNK